MTLEKPEKSVPEQHPLVRRRRRRVGTSHGSENQTTPPVPDHRNSHLSSDTVAQDNDRTQVLPHTDHRRPIRFSLDW